MARRSNRVDAPPPQGRSTDPINPAEPVCVPLRPAAGVWMGGAYLGSAPATAFARAGPMDKPSNQAGQHEDASPADTHNWGNDPRPIGGFVNFLQNPSNFPFPQQIPHQPPISTSFQFGSAPAYSVPAWPPMPNGIATPSHTNLSSSHDVSGSQSKQSIDVDAPENEEVRTTKRLVWIPDEDERLMSSWLNNSNDSIRGICKKNEQYWKEVVDVYNSTTPKSRWRSVKQAKDRWHTVNKLVYQFQCSWGKASKIYSSGQSDDQLMDKAHAFYESDWGGQFLLMKVWKVCRGQPKWHNYNKELEEAKKKKRTDPEDQGEHISSTLPNDDPPRPIGTKKAKAEFYGKSKAKMEMDELEKYQEIQMESSKNRNEILEKQQHLSAEKLETAKIQHLTAKENREARKHDKECEIWKTYRAMVAQDTSGMTDSVQEEHAKAMKAMRQILFGDSQ